VYIACTGNFHLHATKTINSGANFIRKINPFETSFTKTGIKIHHTAKSKENEEKPSNC
jgi:hypothetical protein